MNTMQERSKQPMVKVAKTGAKAAEKEAKVAERARKVERPKLRLGLHQDQWISPAATWRNMGHASMGLSACSSTTFDDAGVSLSDGGPARLRA